MKQSTVILIAVVVNTLVLAASVVVYVQSREADMNSMKSIEEEVKKNSNQLLENKAKIYQLIQSIQADKDTVLVLKEQIKNNETFYYNNLGYLLDLDSSELSTEYRKRLDESYRLFRSGHDIYFPD